MHRRRRGRDAEGQGDLSDLPSEWNAAERRRPRRASGIRADPCHHRTRRRDGALSRSAWRHSAGLHEDAWRFYHPRGSHIVQDRRARADPRRLSRLGNPRAPAARGLRRPHRADAEYSGGLRHFSHGVRHRRNHPSSRRGAEDRFRGSRRRKRRSGFRQGAGDAADVEGVCERAPRRDRFRSERNAGAPACSSSKARTPRT